MDKRTKSIIEILAAEFKNAKCELDYYDDFSLLVAISLSAQTTDKRVNEVTKELFKKYPDAISLSKAEIKDVSNIIKSLGLYKNKTNNIINLSKMLVSNFNSTVPNKREELMTLPGVGRKTANVFLAEMYNFPCMPVDTHIKRVSNILGLTKENDPLKIEKDLTKKIDSEVLARTHLYLLFFGRYVCKAVKPSCNLCKLQKFCIKNKSF